MCSRHCELRGGNKCGAEEEARWLLVRCQRITRADLLALSDRSFRISSKQDEVCAILHFEERATWFCLFLNMATAGLKFASASSLWIDLPHIQKRSWWRSLDEIDCSKYTAPPIGYEDMRFSTQAIDWDWSIDQGRGRRIDHSPSWLVTGKQDREWFCDLCQDVFAVFASELWGHLWLFYLNIYIWPQFPVTLDNW